MPKAAANKIRLNFNQTQVLPPEINREFQSRIPGLNSKFLPTFANAMEDQNAIFPQETYLNGLQNADSSVVDALYNEFRQPVTKAVESAGGSYADGNTFFRVALIHTAGLVKNGRYPQAAAITVFLKTLAVAHYKDWLALKGQTPQEIHEPSAVEETSMQFSLPDSESLQEFRRQIRAKRQFGKLSVEDQRTLQHLANVQVVSGPLETTPVLANNQGAVERFKRLLDEPKEAWESGLPSWAVTALTDVHFDQIWSACEALERRLYSSQIPQSNENKTIKYAFLAFVLLTIGYSLFTWLTRDKSPAEVYENYFKPPESILDDMSARYAKDSVAVERPEACTIAFSQAEAHYKKREWRDAASALMGMMEDSLSTCQSDALFYLGIVGLQMERPELTLDCISNIENLEHFGEDIYWYMALAYVKLAVQDP